MPSEKRRDMDDTWAPEELHKSLKSRDDKKRSSTRDRDKDRERRKDDDRKSRTRGGDRQDRDKDRDKDRERKERDREKDKDRERRPKDRNGDEKKSRDKDGERDRRKRTDEGDRRKPRDDKDRKDRDEKDRRRDRDKDDGERRRRREDREGTKGKDDDRRRGHRDENGERSSKSKEEVSDDSKRDRRRRDKDDTKEKRSKEDESRHRRHDDETEKERAERRRRRREERDTKEETDDQRRERQRERDRHKTEQIDSDEGEKKKSSSSKKREEESNQGDDAYGDYEDDFEDYEDDFEDDDDGSEAGSDKNEDDGPVNNKPNEKSREEMDEILKAMNDENDRLLKESKRPKRREIESDEENDDHKQNGRPSTASKKNFINFKNAKERQVTSKAVGKAARRGRELLQIVDLDFVGYDMFDMPPVNEYELYMRTYGQSDMKQTYVQTNEDNVERDIQTEEIEKTEKWTQYPPEDLRGCGGGDEEPVDPELGSSKPIDSVGLSKFVTKAGSVMCILLEEGKAQGSNSGSMTQRKSNVCVSDGFVELGGHPVLKGRYVSTSWVSPQQTNMLLTIHTEIKEKESSVPGKGLLCVWNLNEPSQPNKLLACEGIPRCCCFSPGGSNLAFAGMQDGSLAVWDLREQMSLHKMFNLENEEYLLRYPTYNTAHVMSNSSHLSAVVSVKPISSAGDSISESLDLNSDGDIEGSSSFQIASLEENSKMHLWVAAELSQPDPAGSESDLGLLPGGKIKLLHSSTIVLESPARETKARFSMQSFDLVLNPKDPSHYYVASDTGCIIHGVRYGGKAPPRAYRGEIDVPLEVTSLDFSPFAESVFLAGCADGSLRLYATKSESPVISWPNVTEGRPIKCVRWCKSRPSVFFVLDDSSNLQIWDLNMSDGSSLKEERVSEERVTSFELTNDHSATGLGLPGRKPQMVVCLESGSVEVHTISKEFSAMMPEEKDQFSQFIESVM